MVITVWQLNRSFTHKMKPQSNITGPNNGNPVAVGVFGHLYEENNIASIRVKVSVILSVLLTPHHISSWERSSGSGSRARWLPLFPGSDYVMWFRAKPTWWSFLLERCPVEGVGWHFSCPLNKGTHRPIYRHYKGNHWKTAVIFF